MADCKHWSLFIWRWFRAFPIALLLFGGLTGQSRAEGSSRPEMKSLIDGFLAQPGSLARKQAAARLQDHFDYIFASFDIDPRETVDVAGQELLELDVRLQRLLTAKVIQNTIDYMAADAPSGSVCNQSDKIRVYRGFGAQPMIRPTGAEKGIFLNNHWTKKLIPEFMNHPETPWKYPMPRPKVKNNGSKIYDPQVVLPVTLQDPDLGETIYHHLNLIGQNTFWGIDWVTAFSSHYDADEEGRAPSGAIIPEEAIFNFLELASSHTSNGAISGNSPLFSVSLSVKVAEALGPGLLALDVCPERLQMVHNMDWMTEFEAYIPLVIFPEEIKEVKGKDCGIAKRWVKERADRLGLQDYDAEAEFVAWIDEICFPTPAIDPNPFSQVFAQCYMNLGTDLEIIVAEFLESPLMEAGILFRGLVERLANHSNHHYVQMLLSQNHQDWRVRFKHTVMQSCPADCALAEEVLQKSKEANDILAPQAEESVFTFDYEEFKTAIKSHEARLQEVCRAPIVETSF